MSSWILVRSESTELQWELLQGFDKHISSVLSNDTILVPHQSYSYGSQKYMKRLERNKIKWGVPMVAQRVKDLVLLQAAV